MGQARYRLGSNFKSKYKMEYKGNEQKQQKQKASENEAKQEITVL